jgi:hypothetical protein
MQLRQSGDLSFRLGSGIEIVTSAKLCTTYLSRMGLSTLYARAVSSAGTRVGLGL